MRKITLMSAAVISAATLSGTSFTSQAAGMQNVNINSGNCRIVRLGANCNLNTILSQLQNCLPGITLPEDSMPQLPEVETPNEPDMEIPSPETPEQDTSTQFHSYVEEIVALVNKECAKEGLAPLTLSTKVSAAAQVRAEEIVTSFSHTRPNGSSFSTALNEQNVSYRRAGENIAWGQKSPEAVMNAWMNSSGHRANIMNGNFTSIGVGYYQINGVNYWCQLFTS